MPNFWKESSVKLNTLFKEQKPINSSTNICVNCLDKIANKNEHQIDTEFEILSYASMNKHKALLKLRNLISEFSSYYAKLFEFNRDISECIFSLYNSSCEPYRSKYNNLLMNFQNNSGHSKKSSNNENLEPTKTKTANFSSSFSNNNHEEIFSNFSSNYNDLHLKINSIFNEFIPKISELIKLTDKFPSYYDEMDNLKKEKDECYKNYAYYQKKVSKLKKYNLKDDKELRNDEKYSKALSEHLRISYTSYDHLNLLDCSLYPIVNKLIIEVFSIEKSIFSMISEHFNNYDFLKDDIITSEKNVINFLFSFLYFLFSF
jgi:hypothetical protein